MKSFAPYKRHESFPNPSSKCPFLASFFLVARTVQGTLSICFAGECLICYPKYMDSFRTLHFRYGSLKQLRCRGYTKSTQHGYRRTENHPIVEMEDKGSHSWTTFLIPATGLLGYIGVAFLIHKNDERRDGKGQGNSGELKTSTAPIIGGPFTLVDTENHLLTEKNLLGNWVLLYFGYSSSPDVGPEQLEIITDAMHILESKQNSMLLPVFVTIDPQRDSPSHLGAYLKEFDPRIIGLTGSGGAVRQMAQEYRVFFKKTEEEGDDYLIESSHKMYLLNPNMEVVRCFGVEYSAEELADALLSEMGRNPA